MRFRHHAPDPRLRGLVHGYWEVEDFHLAHPEQNADLPERTVRLMLSAGELRAGPSPDALRPVLPATLTRFSLRPQRLVVQGRLSALVAELYPWGARQLLGWRADGPPDQLDAALSASAWVREVLALVRQGEWGAAHQALEARLLDLAARQSEAGTGVQAAQRIYASFGTVRVAELAQTLNLSPRTLERQFAREVGVGPKTLARVARFDEANIRIRMNPAVPMADLIFELGFADQSHLIREFRALSTLTPGAFAALAARRRHGMDLDLLQAGESLELEVVPHEKPPGST